MANYQLQVENLRYDPTAWLTEVDKNLERAKQEHRAAEVAYGEMQSKADMFEKLANDVQGKNSQAYQNYINFAKTLRQHTDLLATQGVNPALWRNLIQAKSDYSRVIHPIEEAWNARDREAQRQAKYLEAHPHAIFEKDARDMGIDQWLKNPHYVAKSIDREIVANRAMERYKALQKQVMEMVSQSGMTPDAISRMTPTQVHAYVKQNAPYLYEAIEKRGVSPEEVQRFMAGDPTAIGSILTNVMDETLGMYGLSNWNTDYDHFDIDQNRRRRDNINDMLKSTVIGESTNAIGDSEFKQYKDDISIRWAELAEKKREFDESMNWAKDPRNPANNKGTGTTKRSKITTQATDIETDENNMVSGEKLREFILAKLASNQEVFGNSQITDNQLEKALEDLNISDDKIPDFIQSGYFDNDDNIKKIRDIALTKSPISTGKGIWSALKSIGQLIYQVTPFGMTHSAITNIQNTLVDNEEEKWKHPYEWAILNGKVFSAAYTGDVTHNESWFLNPDHYAFAKAFNLYKTEGIDKAWEELQKHSMGDLNINSKEELLKICEDRDKTMNEALKNLAEAGVISSTRNAESEIQNYINDHKDTGLSDSYLINNMINSKIWNKPQIQSQLGGSTKKSVIEGVGDIVAATSADGEVNIHKYDEKSGVVDNENVDSDDWVNLLEEAEKSGNFVLKTVSFDQSKSGNMNLIVKLGPKLETYAIPISNWNKDFLPYIKQCLREADYWENIANPANIKGRSTMEAQQIIDLVMNGNSDMTLEEYENILVNQGLITQYDVINKTKDYYDAMIQKCAHSRSLSLKESAMIRAILSSINSSHDPQSTVEDIETNNPIRVTPIMQ